MLPGVEAARRRRMRAPAQRRELDPPSTHQMSSNSATEGRRSRGSSTSSSNLAHHHHHHHHHHHYHHHASRSAARSAAAPSTQVRRLQDLLQEEQRAATSQQQNSNFSLLTSSSARDGRADSSGSRGLRGYRGEESRLSTLAMLFRGQARERRLQGAAMEARDRLDERLRSSALPPRFSANPPRQTSSPVPIPTGTTQYDMSVLFSDTDEDENLRSDDEDWERTMREWLAAWAPSLEDRWQPDLFGGNHHHHSEALGEVSHPPHQPREAGMSKAAIDAIKRETYGSKKVAESSRKQEDCPVCLETFLVGQGLLALPCNHKFHPNCLTPWLEGHEQCPYCRARISVGPSTPLQEQLHQQQRGSASVVETENSSDTNYFVSWMSAVEQGMSRLSHGSY